MTTKTSTAKTSTAKAAKVTTGRQTVTVTEPTWADVSALVEMATGAAAIEVEQGKLAEQAATARDLARCLKVRGVYLVAAHPDAKGKPTNASYAARMTGFPRTTVNDILKAGQAAMDKGAYDLSDMLGGVSDKELAFINKFYADGIAAKRREERAKAKADKLAAAAKGDAKGEGDDQSSAGKTDGITGALVVDGLKLAANRCKELTGSKVTMSRKELAEALAYAARITAWAEDLAADSAAAAE
jgi:hypothetical protein